MTIKLIAPDTLVPALSVDLVRHRMSWEQIDAALLVCSVKV
jgi:hypothetical protein